MHKRLVISLLPLFICVTLSQPAFAQETMQNGDILSDILSFVGWISDMVPSSITGLVTGGSWWDTSWQYRKPILVNNTGETTLTDYQVKVVVPFESGMQPDFDDVRFVDSDDSTLLPYWRESYTLSSVAVFWVKIPNIPSGTKTIHIYYGNPSANSISNGDAVFGFFDDFSGSSLDASKWPVSAGRVYLEDGVLHLDYPSNVFSYTQSSYQGVGVVEFKAKYKTDYSSMTRMGRFGYNLYGSASDGIRGIHVWYGNTYHKLHSSDPLVYHNYKVVFDGTQSKWFFDDIYKFSLPFDGTIGTFILGNPGESYREGDAWFDYIFIRKYATVEPTAWLGSEETYEGVGCQNNTECDDGNQCTYDVCVNGSCVYHNVENGYQCDGGICCGGICAIPVCSSNTDCDDGNTCTTDTCVNAGQCDAYCSNSPIATCVNGDGCCPEGCNANNDSDCVGCFSDEECDDNNNCTVDLCEGGLCNHNPVGNGQMCLLEESTPGSELGICCNGQCFAQVCSKDSDCDDGNLCTKDICLNPGACNTTCLNEPITQCVNDDGCCPLGCNANNDNDCETSLNMTFSDSCGDNQTGWSEPSTNARQCGLGGSKGYVKDCCCCYMKSHVHDLGKLFDKGRLNVTYRVGKAAWCLDNATVAYSPDNTTWKTVLIGNVKGKTTVTQTITIPEDFRYVKISIPHCYVDYSNVTLLCSPEHCSNKIDDDCDGFVDCDDSDCASDPSCIKPSTLSCVGGNQLVGDLNNDGKIDQADANIAADVRSGNIKFVGDNLCCIDIDSDGQITDVDTLGIIGFVTGGTHCFPAGYSCSLKENCADGIDNDCDGLVDCNDQDCSNDSRCALPTQRYFDSCGDNQTGWSEPSTNARKCGWPRGSKGYVKDCCCCYIKSHIHDLKFIYPPTTIDLTYKAGSYKGCVSELSVEYSIDGVDWWVASTLSIKSAKKKESTSVFIPGNFRFIKVSIPRCYVDFSNVSVEFPHNVSNYTECSGSEVCNDGIDNDCDGLVDLQDPECVVSHYEKGCYNDDVYWYNSVGKREEKAEECDDKNPCTEDSCYKGKCTHKNICEQKPSIMWSKITPSKVNNTGNKEVLFEVKISPKTKVSQVYVSYSSLGITGVPTNVKMFDDGTYGDKIAGDNIYSYEEIIPEEVAPGTYSIFFKAVNDYGTSTSSATLKITNSKCDSDKKCALDEVCIDDKCVKADLLLTFIASDYDLENQENLDNFNTIAEEQFSAFMRLFVPYTKLKDKPWLVKKLVIPVDCHYGTDRNMLKYCAEAVGAPYDYLVVITPAIDGYGGVRKGGRVIFISTNSPPSVTLTRMMGRAVGLCWQDCGDGNGCSSDDGGWSCKPNPLEGKLGCPKEDYDGDGLPDCALERSTGILKGNVGYEDSELAKEVYAKGIYQEMGAIRKMFFKDKKYEIFTYTDWSKSGKDYQEVTQIIKELNDHIENIVDSGVGLDKVLFNTIDAAPGEVLDGAILPVFLNYSKFCLSASKDLKSLGECFSEEINVPESWVVTESTAMAYHIKDGKIPLEEAAQLIMRMNVDFKSRSIMGSFFGKANSWDENEIEYLSNLDFKSRAGLTIDVSPEKPKTGEQIKVNVHAKTGSSVGITELRVCLDDNCEKQAENFKENYKNWEVYKCPSKYGLGISYDGDCSHTFTTTKYKPGTYRFAAAYKLTTDEWTGMMRGSLSREVEVVGGEAPTGTCGVGPGEACYGYDRAKCVQHPIQPFPRCNYTDLYYDLVEVGNTTDCDSDSFGCICYNVEHCASYGKTCKDGQCVSNKVCGIGSGELCEGYDHAECGPSPYQGVDWCYGDTLYTNYKTVGPAANCGAEEDCYCYDEMNCSAYGKICEGASCVYDGVCSTKPGGLCEGYNLATCAQPDSAESFCSGDVLYKNPYNTGKQADCESGEVCYCYNKQDCGGMGKICKDGQCVTGKLCSTSSGNLCEGYDEAFCRSLSYISEAVVAGDKTKESVECSLMGYPKCDPFGSVATCVGKGSEGVEACGGYSHCFCIDKTPCTGGKVCDDGECVSGEACSTSPDGLCEGYDEAKCMSPSEYSSFGNKECVGDILYKNGYSTGKQADCSSGKQCYCYDKMDCSAFGKVCSDEQCKIVKNCGTGAGEMCEGYNGWGCYSHPFTQTSSCIDTKTRKVYYNKGEADNCGSLKDCVCYNTYSCPSGKSCQAGDCVYTTHTCWKCSGSNAVSTSCSTSDSCGSGSCDGYPYDSKPTCTSEWLCANDLGLISKVKCGCSGSGCKNDLNFDTDCATGGDKLCIEGTDKGGCCKRGPDTDDLQTVGQCALIDFTKYQSGGVYLDQLVYASNAFGTCFLNKGCCGDDKSHALDVYVCYDGMGCSPTSQTGWVRHEDNVLGSGSKLLWGFWFNKKVKYIEICAENNNCDVDLDWVKFKTLPSKPSVKSTGWLCAEEKQIVSKEGCSCTISPSEEGCKNDHQLATYCYEGYNSNFDNFCWETFQNNYKPGDNDNDGRLCLDGSSSCCERAGDSSLGQCIRIDFTKLGHGPVVIDTFNPVLYSNCENNVDVFMCDDMCDPNNPSDWVQIKNNLVGEKQQCFQNPFWENIYVYDIFLKYLPRQVKYIDICVDKEGSCKVVYESSHVIAFYKEGSS